MNFDLDGKTVAITGGASGIGLATAQLLGRDGARIGIVDVRQEAVDHAVALLREEGISAYGQTADVREAAELDAAAQAITSELGPVFGLVACAGIAGASLAVELQGEELRRIIDVNTVGVFLSCQAFGKLMIKQGGGAIVAISSVSSLGGQPARTSYVASKYAVNGIVRTLAIEWAQHNIRVNSVAPNFVDTAMVRNSIPKNFFNSILGRTPSARLAQPSDIAGPIGFLLSDAAGYVTGVTLPVDGGLTAGFMTRQSGADLSSRRYLDAGVYSDD